jgi:ATP-dependent Zn protease
MGCHHGGHLDVVDAEARLDQVLVEVDTSGDATVVDVTDAINRTPSPQTTSADRRRKRFTERVTRTRQPPLLEVP